jgi:hypothetical protein
MIVLANNNPWESRSILPTIYSTIKKIPSNDDIFMGRQTGYFTNSRFRAHFRKNACLSSKAGRRRRRRDVSNISGCFSIVEILASAGLEKANQRFGFGRTEI